MIDPALSRRTFLKGLTGAAGAVLLGGCNPSPPRPQPAEFGGRPTVRVVEWTSLGEPQPFGYTAGPGYWRMSLMYDTLTWPDSTGTQLPWLASSYRRSDDGLLYTVELRDLRWDDGPPLTSRDVAFTYSYYNRFIWTPLLVGVPPKDVEVIPRGDRTVEFRLARPDVTFVQKFLGTMPIVPEHVWSKVADPASVADRSLYHGTGAYRLVTRDVDQGLEAYEANDNYFLGAPWVRRIEMKPADDPLAALKINDLDAAASSAEGVRNEVLAPFREDPDTYGIVTRDAGFAFPLFFNISRGGALADLRFRRAVTHALDRKYMVDQLLTGNGQIGSAGWLPPSHPFYEPAVRDYPFNRAEAERLLDEGGYRRRGGAMRTNPDGSPLRFTLSIPDLVPQAVPELIVENLKAVGIEIELRRIDLVSLFGVKLGANYDLLVTSYPGPSGVGPGGDPEILRGVYYSTPPNPFHKASGYANVEVDRLLDGQRSSLDDGTRRRLLSDAQKKVAEDLPVAMLYYTTFFYVFRKAVFDAWYYTPGGFGPGMPDIYNKHAYITGNKVGLEIRK
jgi:peptide/nickel transport system substrate-binding protein